jgi:hypothetical protein
MVCAEGAAEGLAYVGGAEGRGKVEDGAQDEGGWVRRLGVVAGGAIGAIGEGGRDGWWVRKRGGEGRLEGVLGDEGWAGEAGLELV